MAVISIVVGCLLGFMAGVFSVVFQGASVWQGVIVYLQASILMSLAIATFVMIDQTFFRPKIATDFDMDRDKGPPDDALAQAQIDSFNAQMNAPLPAMDYEAEREDRKSA